MLHVQEMEAGSGEQATVPSSLAEGSKAIREREPEEVIPQQFSLS